MTAQVSVYQELREVLAGRPEVAFAYLHGSFTRGLPYHDLDVALCMHILAKTARAAPASYAECFAGLQKLGLLDDDLAGRLVRMARFRNLLVRRYRDADPKRVLRYIRKNLGDFEDFLAQVGRLADSSPA